MDRASAVKVVDVVVVLLLAASGVAQIWGAAPGTLQGGPAVHTALLLLITLPLLARRRYPLLVCLTVWGVSWLQFELGGGLGQPFFAGVLALYSVGAHAGYPQTLFGVAGAAASLFAVDIPRLAAGDPVDEVVPLWFLLGGVWAFGRWMRRRRAEAVSLTERAEKAESDREERARLAVAEERARIARELHDLVAHSMGVIVIQAQGAQRMLDKDPQAARGALEAIESTGRNGLAEMRRLLGLLTESYSGDDTSPQPRLETLDQLVDQVRSAGLSVDLSIEGTARPLPPGVELAAYRIVQEALTNTLKHAGPASARVALRYLPEGVEVEVADSGAGQAAGHSPGHGLIGMKERVALYGGSLETGAMDQGGYRVLARIPERGDQ
jgi:signal transduction histidine kinase